MRKESQRRIDELTSYLGSLSRPIASADLRVRVQRAFLEQEAMRLGERMEALAAGELDWLTLDEAWAIMELSRRSAAVREIACVVRHDALLEIDPPSASKSVEMLFAWIDAMPRVVGSLLLLVESSMDVTRDPPALRLALRARSAGWHVAVGSSLNSAPLVEAQLLSSTADLVTMSAVESPEVSSGVRSVVSLGPDDISQRPAWAPREMGQVGEKREIELPDADRVHLRDERDAEITDELLSVSGLFGDRVMLRDLEPRASSLDGIHDFRGELGWDAIYVPRKNEPEYARALLRIMGGKSAGAPERIVYVGDTLLNDGGAIRGLQTLGPADRVWGFLCGATKAPPDQDFVLGRIYFGARWASLLPFLSYACADGLVLGEGTWVLFDLDQTVYAAKGRDDEPLVRARWDAARAYLEGIVPAYKFSAARAEALYREFDRDDYHPVTRDNLDYVVLLVLAVASGLADPSEIREYASATRPSIGALAEELLRRASVRVAHEEIAAVLDSVKAVYYNTRAGDQTPCKDFRRLECLAMAARMRGDHTEGDAGRIFLSREVVDVIRYVHSAGATVFAVSDRPVEAAVAEHEGSTSPPTDLMTVRMETRGVPLGESLSRVLGPPSASA
jgi:hypothetical protein